MTVKGYVDCVQIVHETQEITCHQRLYSRGETSFDPLHYLPLLERKAGAFDQAAPLKDWSLPSVFKKVQAIFERRDGKKGTREYIRILRLLELYDVSQVTQKESNKDCP